MVYWGWLGSHPSTIWLKYLGQAIATWRILARDRPAAVFVMSPSPMAVLAVYAYAALTRTPFVIDAHSGAFQNPKWRSLQRMQFWLCRRARATIVTNEHLAALVRHHGGHAVVVPDVPVRFDGDRAAVDPQTFKVVCVTSFGRDEPIEAIVEAARRLPGVTFHMTGDPRRATRRLAGKPPNLHLTGFLDVPRYGALLQSADVVLALTTVDHTMLRGAYEATYQDTPVIVSDFPILRDAFPEGALHVKNTPDAIADAVRQVQERRQDLRDGARRLRARKEQRWCHSKAALLRALSADRRHM
jgi:glycosyltransferase involved in cell wall biosynthesis